MAKFNLRNIIMYSALTAAGILGMISYRQNKEISQLEGHLVKSILVTDVDSDGLTDILIEQNSGNKSIYYNNGTGEYLLPEQGNQAKEFYKGGRRR